MTSSLDLSYLQAVPVVTIAYKHVEFLLIGCGGTGSFLAGSIARLMLELVGTGRKATAVFVDPDTVEDANVPRQNFCAAEIGLNKAKVLAARYGLTYGINIQAIASPLCANLISYEYQKLTVLIGCVDNAPPRYELNKCLDKNPTHAAPIIWWLDCGNHAAAGQVVLGSTCDPDALNNTFNTPNFCIHLPSPAWQHPELLQPRPEELTDNRLSCAELTRLNHQSLFINQRVAAEASDYLLRLTLSHSLKRFATYFDTSAGSSRSFYICPASLKKFKHK